MNSLAFDSVSDIMLFTTNRDGPTAENIQDYLNTFVPGDLGQSIKITPIFINTGLEKVRNAQLVRSVTINLDLGRPLNNFYVQQIENNQPSTLTAALQSIATSAKQDGDSKMLSLVLGLGHGKKDATLELESMLQLLEQINIESDFVKEIIVTYKNGIQDKVDTAKLKNSSILLSYRFSISGSQIAPEYMLNNLVDAVETKRVQFRPVLREYFRNRIETTAQNFEIIEDWRPD